MNTATTNTSSDDTNDINLDALRSVVESSPPDEDEERAEFESAFSDDGDEPAKADEGDSGNDGERSQDSEGEPDKGEPDAGGEENADAGADSNDDRQTDQQVDLHAEIQRLSAELARVQQDNRKLHGRYGDLNTRMNEILQTARQDTVRAGGDVPSKQKIAEAMKSAEKMAALRQEYPEWGDAIEELVLAATDHVSQTIPDPDTIRNMVEEARQKAIVDVKHPDWEETVSTEEFKQWLDAQDDKTRALAYSTRGMDAVRLLDLYKERELNHRQDDDPAGDRPADEPDDNARSRADALRKAMQPRGRGARASARATASEDEEFVRSFYS